MPNTTNSPPVAASRRPSLHPLVELSSCVDPSVLRHPVAQDVIVRITRELRRFVRGDRWPKPHQISGAAFCAIANDRALIADDMGLGKQNPVDTPVITPRGWRRLGDVRVGDFVIGSNGLPTRVRGVFPQGVKPSYRVVFSDHTSVEAGPEHLWEVRYWKGGLKLESLVLTTEQIRTRPVIAQRHKDGGTSKLDLSKVALYLPIVTAPVDFLPRAPSPIGPYTLGQVVANGSTTKDGVHRITTAVEDWTYVERCMQAEGTVLGPVTTRDKIVQACVFAVSEKATALGLDVRSQEKRIPRSYMEASAKDRVALLHGLMDAKGKVTKTGNRLHYSTTSAGLAADVQELVECLGGIASIRSYDRTPAGKPVEYEVRVRLPGTIRPFTLPRKAARYVPGRRSSPARSVVAVEYVRDVESVCISVEAEDGLFLVEHAIVTHNTSTALLRVLLGAHFPAVVICPPSMLLTWKEEAGFWLPGIEVFRLDRVDRYVPQPGWRGVIVTTWNLLRDHSYALARLRPRIIIADEAHYVLNENTERSIHFGQVIQRTPHLLLLTGTPITNRPKDLWRLLHFIDPRAWPEHTQKAFKELGRDDFDKGVQSRLTYRVRQFMLRRMKQQALTDLTAKQYQFLNVQLPDADMQKYLKVEKEFSDWLDTKIRGEVAEELPDLEGEDLDAEVAKRSHAALAAQNLVQFGHLRRFVGRLKAPLAASWIVEAVQAREPVVVFAEHQDVIGLIASALGRRGIRYGIIDGKTTKTRRHSLVKEFQDKKVIDVLLCSSAAKEGLTLTRARHVLFAERFLTAASEDQAADRLHRMGQKRDVKVWIMRALRTVDERVDQLVSKKRRIAGRTVDAEAPAR